MAAGRQTGARISADTYKRLKILAAEQDTTISALVQEAVDDLLRKYTRRGGRKNG